IHLHISQERQAPTGLSLFLFVSAVVLGPHSEISTKTTMDETSRNRTKKEIFWTIRQKTVKNRKIDARPVFLFTVPCIIPKFLPMFARQ
ncbi:MAG: hypothetical protein LUC24_00095, partial [Bacteroidales bacterium]|nr:hypothetical protein [Bacteroidales bacterium]